MKFYFYERGEDNQFNMQDKKSMSKKIGDPYEDLSLEKAAQAVFKQLARRDVWVVDVEIFEIIKKQISFKETKGGIVIKGKKFILDEIGITMESEEEISSETLQITSQSQPLIQHDSQPKQHPHNRQAPKHNIDQPLFYVEFNPGKEIAAAAREGRFTPEKTYAVYKELFNDKGIRNKFVTKDDTGNIREVSEVYFIPGNVTYFAQELGFGRTNGRNNDGLSWDGVVPESGSMNLRG